MLLLEKLFVIFESLANYFTLLVCSLNSVVGISRIKMKTRKRRIFDSSFVCFPDNEEFHFTSSNDIGKVNKLLFLSYQRPYISIFLTTVFLNRFIKLAGNVHNGHKGNNNGMGDNMAFPLNQHIMPSLLRKVAHWDDCNRATGTIQSKFDNKVVINNFDILSSNGLLVHMIYQYTSTATTTNSLHTKNSSMVKLKVTFMPSRPL